MSCLSCAAAMATTHRSMCDATQHKHAGRASPWRCSQVVPICNTQVEKHREKLQKAKEEAALRAVRAAAPELGPTVRPWHCPEITGFWAMHHIQNCARPAALLLVPTTNMRTAMCPRC